MANKKSEISNVPNLRFPGFGIIWEVRKLGEVATNKSKKYNPKNEHTFVKCIELEHLASETGELLGFTDGSQSKSIKNTFHKSDVLFGKLRPYLKKYHQPNFDGVCSSEIWVLNGNEISNNFLYYLIQTIKFIDLANQSSGSKMPRADWTIVENGMFSIPTLNEQKKIADFLSQIDERIQTQNKIIKGLIVFKAAIAKKIFSKKLRFKNENGGEFTEWEEKKLEEVCEKKSSNISANKIEENFGDYIIYGAAGILKNVNFYEEENDYISIVKDGAGVGRLFFCKGKSSVLGTMDLIKPKDYIIPYFLFCLLNTIDFTKYVTGSTIPHIYFKDYKNECFEIPSNQEQTKIANFFSSIDSKIEIEILLLKKFEEQKKFFLQNLFV